MIEINCRQCGAPKKVYPANTIGKKHGNFCNKDCLGKFRTAHLLGDLAAHFKTGARRDRSYIRVHANWHPARDKSGYVSLHRLIAEARLGRFLNDDEIVHHADGNPLNNHWDNLEVMTQSDHAKEHKINGRFSKIHQREAS
jgi:hypothetical protein